MTDREPFSLRRWSERKRAVARAERAPEVTATAPEAPPPLAPAPPQSVDLPAATAAPAPAAPAELPPPETLTFESDFTAYLAPKVDAGLRRAALKQLFRDPRFNVMDGLDVYIDDYSIPSPLEPELASQLVQARYIFDPPKTRVTAEGFVEDVPDEPAEAAPAEPESEPVPDGAVAAPGAANAPGAPADVPPEPPELPAQHPALPVAALDDATGALAGADAQRTMT